MKRIRVTYLLLPILALITLSSQAQVNNPIFNGGAADGAAVAHYVTPTNSAIFSGGTGDGYDKEGYVTPTNSAIFAGGTGDGHDKDAYVTPSNSAIFAGGTGDGHDKEAFVTPTNSAIFTGGFGDGFDRACNNPYIAMPEDPDFCPEDINLDGTVDINDFITFNSAFGQTCDCRADINGDGVVNIQDFIAFNSAFGSDCPTISSLQGDDQLASGFQLSFGFAQALRGIDRDVIHPEILAKINGPTASMDFSIFPNPNAGHTVELYIQRDTSNDATMQIEVYDARGQLIVAFSRSAISESQSEQIYFDEHLSKGMYFIHLLLDGKRAINKFVVQ